MLPIKEGGEFHEEVEIPRGTGHHGPELANFKPEKSQGGKVTKHEPQINRHRIASGPLRFSPKLAGN